MKENIMWFVDDFINNNAVHMAKTQRTNVPSFLNFYDFHVFHWNTYLDVR